MTCRRRPSSWFRSHTTCRTDPRSRRGRRPAVVALGSGALRCGEGDRQQSGPWVCSDHSRQKHGGFSMAQAGWYADPTGTGGDRWWDGSVWTVDVVGSRVRMQPSGRPQTEALHVDTDIPNALLIPSLHAQLAQRR
ncbi:DUF2510 domain-containing protein [Nocardia sp. IFM 10818]